MSSVNGFEVGSALSTGSKSISDPDEQSRMEQPLIIAAGDEDTAAESERDALARLSMFRKALALGSKLLGRSDPDKARLFKRGHALISRNCRLRTARVITVVLLFTFILGAFAPVLMASEPVLAIDASSPTIAIEGDSTPTGTPEDFQLGALSANLTTSVSGSIIMVMTEEYKIQVDYRTSYVDYKILPYFCTDFIRYRRVNPQYTNDGTYDSSGAALNAVSMTISKWGRTGNTVWFLESCPEFSLNQTFTIYRDYFELNVIYKPGTKNVLTTYFFGLYSASNSLYPMVSNGHYYRYVPGYEEDRSAGAGMGGWYPSLWMYAPAFDMRAKAKTMGLEVGLNETVCYLGSPIWMNEPGTGGENVFAVKYFSKDSVAPHISAGTSETFHLFVRPYKYTDGQDRGHDAGYAQWVSAKVAAAYGHPQQAVFPLLVMDLATWSTSFRTWVESSQVKVATQSDNPNQYDWNYKCSQLPNKSPGDPANVPVSWQVYSAPGVPMTIADGRVICNPISGPYNVPNTFRWQLINNDPYMDWWTGSRGVFWDMMNMWSADNDLRSDYNIRNDFIMTGYLALVDDSFKSGYWDYVISNTFTALLQPSIASSISIIEGYQPSSVYGTGMVEHVHSTMNFTANIPEAYRPRILVYQNYDSTSNANDQEDVYSALFGSARYGFDVTLVSYDSFDSQMHNYVMAEAMFKAMGCTRDSDTRIPVGTLDLAVSQSLTTGASMVVIKGGAKATITESSNLASFTITNLHATSNDFDLRAPGGGYFAPGSGVTTLSPMTYTPDGYAKFSGRVDAEKTATVIRNENIQVYQRNSGSATVSLTSIGPSADLMVHSTGGMTDITIKGFVPGKTYKILVNSIVVEQRTAATDGSITFSRTYGSNDRVQTQVASVVDSIPPHVSSITPTNGATSIPVTSQVRVTFNESMDKVPTQGAFTLSGPSQVSGSFSWESSDTVLVFTPAQSLSHSTSYVVQVATTAKDASGNLLSPSFSSSFTTGQQTVTAVPPSAPLGLTAIGGAKTVSRSWSAPSNVGGAPISGYKVYRGTSSNGQSSTPLATIGNVTNYQDIGASDGTTYYYKVSAINSAGEGTKSLEAQGTTFNIPGPPGTPTAVGSYRSVSLSWSPPSNNGGSSITGYRIYRGQSAQSLTLLTTLSNVLSYTDSGLSNGTSYYYKVSAINNVGEGSASGVSSATTSSTAPGQPTNLRALGSSDRISLNWTAPSTNGGSAVTGYKLYRGTDSGQLSLLINLGNVLSYVDSNLSNGATYLYQVSALNVIGESARSSEVQGTTAVQVPSEPLMLRASALDGKVRLNWDAPETDGGTPIQTYQIYRSIGVGQKEVVAVIASAQSHEDAGLMNGVSYRYQVSAANLAGEGALSNEVSANPLGLPGVPLNLQALPADDKIGLSWAPPSDLGGSIILGYRIFRGDSPSSMSPLLAQGPTTNYDDLAVTNGHLYYYAVAAINEVGEGATPSPISCVPGYVPSAPISLLASPSDSRNALSWAAPLSDNGHEIIGYNVYRGLSSENLALLASLPSTTSYFDQAVSNGVTYYYRVTASNSMGEGAFSPLASAKPATLPGSPLSLSAVGGVGSIDLAWSAPADGGDAITGYAIYRGTSPSSLTQVAIASSTNYHDSSLSRSTLYHYEVKAVNSIGQGPSASAFATTAGLPTAPTGLDGSASETSATLTWSAPGQNGGSLITNYNIYRGLAPQAMNLVATTTGTTYEDSGLEPGTSYLYSVRAVNMVGEGPSSGTKDITTLISVPSVPHDFKAISGTNRIDLSWEEPASNGGSPIIEYHIYKGSAHDQLSFLSDATLAAFSDPEVSPGQTYYYQVAAVNVVGEGGTSPEVSAKAMTLPSVPIGLQATKGKSSVSLTWGAPGYDGGAAISGYAIYRGSNPDSMYKLALVGAIQQYSDASLPKTNTVYYRVSAVNAAGEGAHSDMVSVALTKKASAPRNLAVSSQDGKLLLSWDAPEDDGGSDITSYAIYRHSADGESTRVAVVNSTILLDMGLTNGATYSYSIAAINTVGEGNLTSNVSGKPFGLPSSPPYLNATPYDQMVLLRWDAPTDDGGDPVVGYDIFMVEGGEERYLGQVANGINSYVCNGLKNGVDYVFHVAAVNAAGESEKCMVMGTPEAAASSAVAKSNGIQLGSGIFMISALGALALSGMMIGVWRTRSNKLASRQKAKHSSGAARRDVTVRVQVAQARMMKTPKPISTSALAEDAAFERTLRDLEVSNRIL
jgi:fibronectin type 3 domain-containing protein